MKTIFVVDDDPEQAQLLAAALASEGRRIRAFSDPIRALAALVAEGADLVLADLSMPWIDGTQVALAARELRPSMALVLVSGYPRGADVAAQLGVPFFKKPIDLGQLRMAVDQLLEGELEFPGQGRPPYRTSEPGA